MLFHVARTTIAGRSALTVRGELDIATAPLLITAAEMLLETSPQALVVDLTPTVFLDSSGARALLVIARQAAAAGVDAHVIAPHGNRPVRLPIDLLELGTAVPIVGSAAELPAAAAGSDGP